MGGGWARISRSLTPPQPHLRRTPTSAPGRDPTSAPGPPPREQQRSLESPRSSLVRTESPVPCMRRCYTRTDKTTLRIHRRLHGPTDWHALVWRQRWDTVDTALPSPTLLLLPRDTSTQVGGRTHVGTSTQPSARPAAWARPRVGFTTRTIVALLIGISPFCSAMSSFVKYLRRTSLSSTGGGSVQLANVPEI